MSLFDKCPLRGPLLVSFSSSVMCRISFLGGCGKLVRKQGGACDFQTQRVRRGQQQRCYAVSPPPSWDLLILLHSHQLGSCGFPQSQAWGHQMPKKPYTVWFEWERPPETHMLECVVPSWWNHLGRFGRCGHAGGGVSLRVDLEVSPFSVSLSASCLRTWM